MALSKKDEIPVSAELEDKIFLEALGNFIRKMRIAAGFKTIRSFVDTFDISYSQYQGYETGKNITILSLKKVLIQFNLKPQTWLNLNLFEKENNEILLVQEMKQARIQQVIEQVKFIEPINKSSVLSPKEAQRYIDILIFCHTAKSRKEILIDLLKMDDSSNTFKRVAGKLLFYGWIRHTDEKNKNNPTQRYYTTELGKIPLTLGK